MSRLFNIRICVAAHPHLTTSNTAEKEKTKKWNVFFSPGPRTRSVISFPFFSTVFCLENFLPIKSTNKNKNVSARENEFFHKIKENRKKYINYVNQQKLPEYRTFDGVTGFQDAISMTRRCCHSGLVTYSSTSYPYPLQREGHRCDLYKLEEKSRCATGGGVS